MMLNREQTRRRHSDTTIVSTKKICGACRKRSPYSRLFALTDGLPSVCYRGKIVEMCIRLLPATYFCTVVGIFESESALTETSSEVH